MIRLSKISDTLKVLYIHDVTIWFSYETPIAFKIADNDVVIRKNEWGRATGGHIGMIKREHEYIEVDGKEFEKQLSYLFT